LGSSLTGTLNTADVWNTYVFPSVSGLITET